MGRRHRPGTAVMGSVQWMRRQIRIISPRLFLSANAKSSPMPAFPPMIQQFRRVRRKRDRRMSYRRRPKTRNGGKGISVKEKERIGDGATLTLPCQSGYVPFSSPFSSQSQRTFAVPSPRPRMCDSNRERFVFTLMHDAGPCTEVHRCAADVHISRLDATEPSTHALSADGVSHKALGFVAGIHTSQNESAHTR